MIVLYIDISC